MPRTEKQNKAYKNPDDDPRGRWRPNNLAARNFYSKGTYSIRCPGGRLIEGPPAGSYWRVSEEKFREMDREGRIWWGRNGNNVPAPKIYLDEVKQGIVPQTLWSYEDVGHTQIAKKEIVNLFGSDVFGTPKPEQLIERIMHIATHPGDLVLDSFLGSGTTAAVAHKMGRRWIGIEMGEHAVTHCVPRLRKVIEGEQGGISRGGRLEGRRRISLLPARPPGVRRGRTHPTRRSLPRPRRARVVQRDRPALERRRGIAIARPARRPRLRPAVQRHPRRSATAGGNVLTRATLAGIRGEVAQSYPDLAGARAGYPLTVYGEQSRLTPATLARERIDFKQTPYDVRARA